MTKKEKHRKANIPRAIREQCWIVTMGEKFENKCYIKCWKQMLPRIMTHG